MPDVDPVAAFLSDLSPARLLVTLAALAAVAIAWEWPTWWRWLRGWFWDR